MLTTKQFTEQLRSLVGFRTLTGDMLENAKALDYVQSLISPKATLKRIKNKSAEILLASNSNTMSPTFGYMVHMDVVFASDDMFEMRETGGKLYGRGVSDMKFSIPLGVALLNELIEQQSDLTFCLAITTDEEVGGYEGGAYLAGEYGWKPQTLIVPDGGDNMQFVEKAKGVCQLIITATGTSAHASRTWDGKNALVPLAQLIVELEKRYGENNKTAGWATTLNFGKLEGGVSTNQVCDRAVLNLDFRYPETDSIERIKADVDTLISEIDSTMLVEFGSVGLPTFTDTNVTVVKDFLRCMEEQTQKPILISNAYGASDARHFAKLKIPILMLKPLGGDIHCETEWIEVKSTFEFYQGLRAFLQLI